VSEAEVFDRAGIKDILVSNQITRQEQIERLAKLAAFSRILVCADNLDNVRMIAELAKSYGVTIEVLVEIDVGAGRCGVEPGRDAVKLASCIAEMSPLRFGGLQAYHGPAQHFRTFGERKSASERAIDLTQETVELLAARGLTCDIVAGAGTGTFMFEGASKVYNELQAGSYAFMDGSYAAILDESGKSNTNFRHALFLATTVISKTRSGRAVGDAGLKSQAAESGLPLVHSLSGVEAIAINDEHVVLADSGDLLSINDQIALIPSHCDPTCNL